MLPFIWWVIEWLGVAVVSLWALLDFAVRLVAVGILAKLAWRAKDDDGSLTP